MSDPKPLKRRPLIAELNRRRGNAAIVAGLGSPTYDCAAAADRPLNFYLWGGMGGASMVGLGVALAQPDRRVIVVTGDGEMLMGVGSFAAIAVQSPQNLAVLILDNEAFSETGQQPGLTRVGVDLSAMAKGAGIRHTMTACRHSQRDALLCALLEEEGPVVAVAKVPLDIDPVALPSTDGLFLSHRFREAMLRP